MALALKKTYKGWYAIKQRNQSQENPQSVRLDDDDENKFCEMKRNTETWKEQPLYLDNVSGPTRLKYSF